MAKQDTEEKARSLTTFRNYMEAADHFKDPVERCAFYDAIMHYGFDGIEPQNLNEIGRLLFRMIKPSLDKSINNRRPGNTNATGTRIERDSNTNETRIEREHLLENKNENKNIENKNIENTLSESTKDFPTDFRKWTLKQFRESVEQAIEQDPKLAPYREAFCDYYLAQDPKGIPLFARQKTWDTAGRLRTFWRRDQERREPQKNFAPAEPMPIEDAIAQMRAEQERANRLRNGEVC